LVEDEALFIIDELEVTTNDTYTITALTEHSTTEADEGIFCAIMKDGDATCILMVEGHPTTTDADLHTTSVYERLACQTAQYIVCTLEGIGRCWCRLWLGLSLFLNNVNGVAIFLVIHGSGIHLGRVGQFNDRHTVTFVPA